MRFTVTIEAPEPCNALQGLAALPEGWRVVEYREVEKKEPTTPSIAELLRRQVMDPFSMVSLPTIGLSNPKGAFVVSPTSKDVACNAPDPAKELVTITQHLEVDKVGELDGAPLYAYPAGKPIVPVQHGPPELQEPHTVHFMQEKAWGYDEAKGKDRSVSATIGGIPVYPHPAVPPDTIVGLNPDGTIAGVAKIDANSQP